MFPSRLYAIVDEATARQHGWSGTDLAGAFLRGGARLLQVRANAMPGRAFLEMCEAIVDAARRSDAVVIVNDRADVARLAGAAGVHLGQDDLPVRGARVVLGPEALIGVSTHTIDQVEASRGEPADYIAIGPVFPTGTKMPGRLPVGLGLVQDAARLAAGRPVVAIGGITLDRAPDVIRAGAAAVAVIADLLSTGDPEARTREFLRVLKGREEF